MDEENNTIMNCTLTFSDNAFALKEMLFVFMSLISFIKNTGTTKLEKMSNVKHVEEGLVIEHPMNSDLTKTVREVEKLKTFDNAGKILPKSILVSLVSEYDSFLCSFIKAIYIYNNEIFQQCNKKFDYQDLIEHSDIEQLKKSIIDEYIDDILRKNHGEQLKDISKIFNVDFEKIIPKEIIGTFIEATERRNLFVHAGGQISKQYLESCKKNNIDTKHYSLNQELDVKAQYFKQAFKSIFCISVCVAQMVWRKCLKNQLEIADQNLQEIMYDLLCKKEYDLLIDLASIMIKNIQKFFDETFKKVFYINYALAYKFKKDEKNMKKIIEKLDWTSVNNLFQLIIAVINDDFSLSEKIMLKMKNDEEVIKLQTGYVIWPVFEEFRKTQNFKRAYKSIYHTDYDSKVPAKGKNICNTKGTNNA